MTLKNANFIQKHVEKLILGAAVLVALLIVLFYAVGSPYTATIANQERGPRDIESYLVEQARDLDRRVSSDQPQFEAPQIAGYSDELTGRLALRPAPMPRYAAVAGRGGLSPADINLGPEAKPFAIPRPPVPTEVTARAGFAVLGQLETPEQHDQFVQLVGQKTPWDIRYVSVAGEWPLAEWQKRLENSDLPISFWRAMIGISAVYLQREELDPLTGEWGNTTIVTRMPTQVAAMPGEAAEYNDETAAQFVQYLREQQANIARPNFPPLAQGEWLPPGSDYFNLDPAQQQRLKDLRNDINNVEKRIQLILDRQKRAAEAAVRSQNRPQRTQRQRPEPTNRRPSRRDMEGMMDDPAMMGGPQMPPGGGANNSADEAQQLQRLTIELQEKRRERDELIGVPQDTLTDITMMDPYIMMYDPSMMDPGMMDPGMMDPYGNPYGQPGIGRPGMPGATNPFARPGMGRPGVPAQPAQPQADASSDTIRVWAHDLTVEPGKTYRYRVLVSVLNPLFRQNRVAPEQKSEFFNQVALGPDERELAASAWTDPVKVDPETYFFFLSGSTAGQIANVEVWKAYNGQWFKQTFQESPGNPIGGPTKININGVEEELNMETGSVMVDLVSTGGGLGNDVRLLYFDPTASQAISYRNSQQDERNNDRIRLENLRSLQAEAVASSASAVR